MAVTTLFGVHKVSSARMYNVAESAQPRCIYSPPLDLGNESVSAELEEYSDHPSFDVFTLKSDISRKNLQCILSQAPIYCISIIAVVHSEKRSSENCH